MELFATKKREQRGELDPCWRIYFNGHRTRLFIEKATEPPKWGMGQEYDLCHDEYGFIVNGAVYSLMQVAALMGYEGALAAHEASE